VILIISNFLSENQKKEVSYILFVPVIFFLFGFGSYLLTQTLLIKNPITKYLIVPASLALGASVSHAMSGQIINTAIEAPASSFIHTQAILTVFSAPLVLGISFAFSGLFLAFLMLIDFTKLKKFKFLDEFKTMTPIVRMVTFISAWTLSLSLLNNYSEPYNAVLENVAKWSIYNLESELFSYCEKEKNERVSYIDSDLILISKLVNESYEFKITKCNKKL